MSKWSQRKSCPVPHSFLVHPGQWHAETRLLTMPADSLSPLKPPRTRCFPPLTQFRLTFNAHTPPFCGPFSDHYKATVNSLFGLLGPLIATTFILVASVCSLWYVKVGELLLNYSLRCQTHSGHFIMMWLTAHLPISHLLNICHVITDLVSTLRTGMGPGAVTSSVWTSVSLM